MNNVKISKATIDQFFKEHKDAAAVFVMAGLAHGEIASAIGMIEQDGVKPGSRKGYESVVRQLLKQRQSEPAAGDSDGKAVSPGISKTYPVVFPIAESDPKVAGVPWMDRGVLKVRLVDIEAMLACLEKEEAAAKSGNDRDAKVSYVYSLNLGKPRLLQSPTKQQVDKVLQLRESFPHFRTVIERIHGSLHSRMLAAAPTKFPPILLVSSPGLGKTELVKEVGRILDIESHLIASAAQDPLALVGLGKPWAGCAPGKVAQSLAIKLNEDKAANCIFFIDEIDKAGMSGKSDKGNTTSFFDQLLSSLESPYSFVDSYFGEKAAINTSMFSWIFAANDLELVPTYFLSRCEVHIIENPNLEDWKSGALLKSIFHKVLSSAPYASFFVPMLSEEVADKLAYSGKTPREIRRAIELALERALSRYSEPPEAGSVWLSPEDFSFPVASQKRSIGFHSEVCK
jgi:hypothetical protein